MSDDNLDDYQYYKNLVGNAEGAAADAGLPGNTKPHDAIYLLIDQRDKARNQGFKEGYAMGDFERVALATANSGLRSEILKLADENNELHHKARMQESRVYAPNVEYVPHHPHPELGGEMSTLALADHYGVDL